MWRYLALCSGRYADLECLGHETIITSSTKSISRANCQSGTLRGSSLGVQWLCSDVPILASLLLNMHQPLRAWR